MAYTLPGVLGNNLSNTVNNSATALESTVAKLNTASTLSNDIYKVTNSSSVANLSNYTLQPSNLSNSIGIKLGSIMPSSLSSGLTGGAASLKDSLGLKAGMTSDALALSTALAKAGDVAIPSFNRIGSPTNLAFVTQVGGDFSQMADKISIQASKLVESANQVLANPTNIPNLTKLMDNIGQTDTVKGISKALVTTKNGVTIISDISKASSGLLDSAKNALTNGSAALKSAFAQLPQSIQKGVLSAAGVLAKNAACGINKSINTKIQVNNLVSKITSGQYTSSPCGIGQDIKNLTSFALMELKNGLNTSILLNGATLGLSGTIMGKVAVSVGYNLLATKNGDALKAVGTSLYGNRSIVDIGSSKPNMADVVFSSLKEVLSNPKLKRTSYDDLRKAERAFIPAADVAPNVTDVSSMCMANSYALSTINYVKTDNSVLPRQENMTHDEFRTAQIAAMGVTTIDTKIADAAMASMGNINDNSNNRYSPTTPLFG